MKFLYIGNFGANHTEAHISGTLRDMGHTVIEAQENILVPGDLLRMATNEKPDLVLWTRTWPGFVTMRDLEELKAKGYVTVSYHLDLYVGLQRQSGLDSDPFWHTEYVFTADGDPHSQKVFESKGINHHWLKAGVYKAECKPGRSNSEHRSSIAFTGTSQNYHPEWPYREELINFLRSTYGSWFKCYGNPYSGVRGQDLNDMLASTDIIIGDTLCPGYTHENYFSDRVFEITGRGGFIIHPRIKGLEKCFVEHEEIAFYDYGDFDHLKKLIDWYLDNPNYREAVRQKGMQRTINDHTYHSRMKEMLGLLKQEGAIK